MRPSILARLGSLVVVLAVVAAPAQATPDQWQAKEPTLITPWTHEVGPNNALPEYPRPQLTRQRWQNLNGVWDYAGGSTPPADTHEQILVPYPPESALSGIQRHDDLMLYRRNFDVPPDWRGQRVLLHFGAVDQKAEVRVNGRTVARHDGGYTAFSADITDALRPGPTQELEVSAEDRNEANPYPVGKQSNTPQGIVYTGSSGIWQTVWMEPVAPAHVDRLDVTPEVGSGSFALTAHTTGAPDHRIEVIASTPDGREVARTTGAADADVQLPVPQPHLWTPDDPFLYTLAVRLIDPTGKQVDEVGSYAGLRSIGLVRDAQGRNRMALNGKILFQFGPLDQGFWPDGLYTAPTDAALRFDLEQTKRLGFNAVRKHVKVEPARWYYWADHLGLLVWQDMPSLPIDLSRPPQDGPQTPGEDGKAHYDAELSAMIDQLRSVTSIVVWVAFNEGWGEFDTAAVADRIRKADPTRLVDASSGVNCCYSLPDSGAGQIYDDHTYVGPGKPTGGARAAVDGEFGGLGLVEQDHVWTGTPQAYEMTTSRDQLGQRYGQVGDDLAEVIRGNGLSAAIYTQLTDVENEVNGLFTYDRQVLKPDANTVRDHNRAVIAAGTS